MCFKLHVVSSKPMTLSPWGNPAGLTGIPEHSQEPSESSDIIPSIIIMRHRVVSANSVDSSISGKHQSPRTTPIYTRGEAVAPVGQAEDFLMLSNLGFSTTRISKGIIIGWERTWTEFWASDSTEGLNTHPHSILCKAGRGSIATFSAIQVGDRLFPEEGKKLLKENLKVLFINPCVVFWHPTVFIVERDCTSLKRL